MELDYELDLKGLSVAEYFNPNLVDIVGLPEKEGTYDVHAEFRGYKSNTVRIRVVEKKDKP